MRKLHKKPLVLAAAAIALTGSLTVGSGYGIFYDICHSGRWCQDEYGIHDHCSG